MCIPVHALLSGLVRRVAAGHRVTRDELETLEKAGVPRADLVASLRALEPSSAREHALSFFA